MSCLSSGSPGIYLDLLRGSLPATNDCKYFKFQSKDFPIPPDLQKYEHLKKSSF